MPIFFVFIGIIVFFLLSQINYKKYQKYYYFIYAINIIILLIVLVFGVTRLGAKRWIDLKFIVIQPSEFSKILIILTFSEYLVKNYTNKRGDGIKKVIVSFTHILPVFLLIAKQPDLGTSLVLIFIYFVIIFINGINWRVIATVFASLIAFIPFAFTFLLKSYQQQRILTFINPESDLLGSGWNVNQSMIAIGSGGFMGKGFMNSSQSKLHFLPESHTDFIGSVFLEEMGTFYLIYQIINIGDRSRDEYGKLICYGIGSVFFFHVTVNLGMIMGIMPVTGLPLLFMSYGGSSLIFSFIMLGIVQSVRIHSE